MHIIGINAMKALGNVQTRLIKDLGLSALKQAFSAKTTLNALKHDISR